MTESELKFHLEEYKELRKEVLDKITKAETFIQYAVVISAGVFSWLVTQEFAAISGKLSDSKLSIFSYSVTRLAWGLPFAATIVIGIMGIAQYLRIKEMGEYLHKLEMAMGNSRLGWEAFLARKAYTVAPVFALAWLVLFLGTGCVALFIC